MALPQNPIVKLVSRFAAKLRFPTLFLITAGLFLLDLVIPDVIPFADELLLGLGTCCSEACASGAGSRGVGRRGLA